ncbi:MAG: hypothetical protein IH593_10355, partial [Bacteroidales bacterium]|nr:hypothetical protein [Bacteroidales bacterium]
ITDIGAYEMVYSRWSGRYNVTWTFPKNWEGNIIPGTTSIVIPGGLVNYPTAAPGASFTLNAGLHMIMNPGSRVTFSSLTNNGTIYLQSNATAMASLITNSYSGTGGSLKLAVTVTGGDIAPDVGRWHYIAAPMTMSKSVITDIDPENLINYDESKVTTDVIQGWQWHDGWDGTTGFNTLEAKRGYNIAFLMDTTILYDGITSLTTSMGQINLPFSGSGRDTSLYGYSLIGNSLTCGINWDLVTRSDTGWVRNAIFFTKDDYVASYVRGVGTNGGSAHIPPMQGFFVKTRATGTYIIIPDNAREHSSTLRYKSAENIPLIRLELSSDEGRDETVIRLDSHASAGFDNELDAAKMFAQLGR